MHSFEELIFRTTKFTLATLGEVERHAIGELQHSGSTIHVKNLQIIQLQKVISSVGMFSIFEASLQQKLNYENGFVQARKKLIDLGLSGLEKRFQQFIAAINVLKHGQGRSYEFLLDDDGELPFRLKKKDEHFFDEGDVSEIQTLVEVDDNFVENCASLISEISLALDQ